MSKQSLEINFRKTKEANRISQTRLDLLNHLKKQYKFLSKSLQDIQKGDLDEIDRLAITLRILLHTSKNQKSLLSQIDPEMKVFDTCPKISLPPNHDETISQKKTVFSCYAGIVTLTSNPTEMWKLTPSNNPSWVGIEEWWKRLLFVDQNIKFTPKELVCCIANTDGGAHVDPNLKSHYYYLKKTGSVGMEFFIDGKQHFPSGPQQVILPHIGYEVITSLTYLFSAVCPEYKLYSGPN